MKPARALRPGETIGIAAASSPFDRQEFLAGAAALEGLGFRVRYRPDIFETERYLAGSDARRAEELTALFADPLIAAIMFARGGYGAQRIIPLLDRDEIRRHPKPVVGFSDLTPLLTWLEQSCRIPTFYGPVLTMLGRPHARLTDDALSHALMAAGPVGAMPTDDATTLKTGKANGRLVGGCLSLIAASMGTPYELETAGAILFCEEIREKVYAIDRMLTQLAHAGKLAGVRGIIVGRIVPRAGETHDLTTMLADRLAVVNGPVVMNYPAGHVDPFVTLPLGVEAELSVAGDGASFTITTGLLS